MSKLDHASLEEVILGALNSLSRRRLTTHDLDSKVSEIGLDSLRFAEVIIRLEDDLGIFLNQDDLQRLSEIGTSRDMLSIISDVVQRAEIDALKAE